MNTPLPALLASLCLAHAGCTALCLGLERYWRQTQPRHAGHPIAGDPGRRQPPSQLRPAGWLLTALSLLPCLHGWGWAMGLALWPGNLFLAAALVAFLLPYQPHRLLALGGGSTLLGLFLLTTLGTLG